MKKAFLVLATGMVYMLAGSAGAQPATKTAASEKTARFPLTVGSEWTYRIEFAVRTPLWYDPYFIQPALLATSLSHGTTARLRDPGPAASFVVKVAEVESPGIARLEVSEDGLRHWFAPGVENPKFVITASTDKLPENHPWMMRCQESGGEWKDIRPFVQTLEGLEIRAKIQMKKDPEKPAGEDWILGQILAMAPSDGKTRVERCGWLAELSNEAVTVPAGTYRTVFHSRIPKGHPDDTPRHFVESWVAPGVGLVKSTVLGSEGKARYSIVLTGATIR